MRILITGGAGFIGSHIAEYFHTRASVRILDNLRSGSITNLIGIEHEFIESSILNRKAVRKAMQGVDYVFHLAAMISVPESMKKPVECVRLNTLGTLILLEEAAHAKVKKFCFSSSAAVYGNAPELPKTESMRPTPQSPYAMTKLDGEYYCAMFEQEYGLPTVSLRYFNVFGPRQDPNSPYAAAIPSFIARARKGGPLTIYGDGGQTRDFVFVKDVAAANAHFVTRTNATGTFNVAYGISTRIASLANTIISITKQPCAIEHQPARPGDIRHSKASIDKLLKTGFKPASQFYKALEQTVQALSAHPDGYGNAHAKEE